MTREKIQEMIVVEGKNDSLRLRHYFDCHTIETNGSAVSHAVIEQVRLASARRGVIIFTDPDYPGGRIRQILDDHVPEVKHAFLPIEAAKNEQKGKVGIEHASYSDLYEALTNAKVSYRSDLTGLPDEFITAADLFAAGLTAGPGAGQKRRRLGEKLGIGYANSKQLQKRLRQFQITNDEFINALNAIEKEQSHATQRYCDTKPDERNSE